MHSSGCLVLRGERTASSTPRLRTQRKPRPGSRPPHTRHAHSGGHGRLQELQRSCLQTHHSWVLLTEAVRQQTLNFLGVEESCDTEEEINEGQDHFSATRQLSSWLGVFQSLAKLGLDQLHSNLGCRTHLLLAPCCNGLRRKLTGSTAERAAVSYLFFQSEGQRPNLEAVTSPSRFSHSKEPLPPTASPTWERGRKHREAAVLTPPCLPTQRTRPSSNASPRKEN